MVLRSRISSNVTIHQMYLYIFVYVVTFSVTRAKDLTNVISLALKTVQMNHGKKRLSLWNLEMSEKLEDLCINMQIGKL